MENTNNSWIGILGLLTERQDAQAPSDMQQMMRDAMTRIGREGARPDVDFISFDEATFMREHNLHSLWELAEYLCRHPQHKKESA